MYPVIGEALKAIAEYSRSAKLTGTGACVFGEFADESEAREAARKLSARWRVFVAKAANRSPTHHVLGLA
jgi:4-diphosphocytidyl-2-C-methyl-D-erythritol kinase